MSTFHFDGYKVDYINYAINHEFQATENLNIEMGLEVETNVDEENLCGTVTIHASFFDSKKDNYPFALELAITGWFRIHNYSDPATLHKRIKINGTTALFPFLRSTVADITKTANVQPLIMPLINIHAMLEEQELKSKPE